MSTLGPYEMGNTYVWRAGEVRRLPTGSVDVVVSYIPPFSAKRDEANRHRQEVIDTLELLPLKQGAPILLVLGDVETKREALAGHPIYLLHQLLHWTANRFYLHDYVVARSDEGHIRVVACLSNVADLPWKLRVPACSSHRSNLVGLVNVKEWIAEYTTSFALVVDPFAQDDSGGKGRVRRALEDTGRVYLGFARRDW